MSLRTRPIRAMAVCVVVLAAWSPALQAQAAASSVQAAVVQTGQAAAPAETARQGAWFGAGVGGGWTRVNCAICRTDRFAGPSAALRFGTTLRPGLLVAGEVDGWTRSSDDVRSVLTAGSAAAYVYPDPRRGLFLKAGAGLVHYSLDSDSGTNLFGLLLGAGYDIPLGESLSITNTIGLIASSFGSLRSGTATVAEDVSISVFHVGISLTHR